MSSALRPTELDSGSVKGMQVAFLIFAKVILPSRTPRNIPRGCKPSVSSMEIPFPAGQFLMIALLNPLAARGIATETAGSRARQ